MLATEPLWVWIRPTDDGRRVSLFANSIWLGEALVMAATRTPHLRLRRVILAIDYDEYGAEHVVFTGVDGGLCRLQHVYVHPGGEPDEECGPGFANIPACDTVEVATDGTINGAASWSAVAATYGVPVEPVERAGRYAAVAHEKLGRLFTPFVPWWEAVHVPYPGDLGTPDVVLLDTKAAA